MDDVPIDQVIQILREEFGAPSFTPPDRLGEPATECALQILLPRCRANPGHVERCPPVVLLEDDIDEPVRSAVELSLGERPELNGLHPPHQRVRQAPKTEQACRASQQKPAGRGFVVDRGLDRQDQFRLTLDFVYGQQAVVTHETARVKTSGLPLDSISDGV